jgi:hypothetical protein
MDEEKLVLLVQEHECLYNLSNPDYDNNLIKDNVWKDIARHLHSTVDDSKQNGPCYVHITDEL